MFEIFQAASKVSQNAKNMLGQKAGKTAISGTFFLGQNWDSAGTLSAQYIENKKEKYCPSFVPACPSQSGVPVRCPTAVSYNSRGWDSRDNCGSNRSKGVIEMQDQFAGLFSAGGASS